MAQAMTSKDPSGPIIRAAFALDTRHGPHPCLTCRNYLDPFDPELGGAPYTPLDLAPSCVRSAYWFMERLAQWQCTRFEREPGDQ